MNAPQLPAHLQHLRPQRQLAASLAHDFATSSMPPYISIEGNRFTLVDAAGNTKPVETFDPATGPYVDCVVVDISDQLTRTFYAANYDPGNTAPPDCFSDNGIAPSYRAQVPQARSCTPDPTGQNGCKWAVWGSATSKMTGKPVPACRQRIKMAVIIPGIDMLFLLAVPPASIQNAVSYGRQVSEYGLEMPLIITRVTFAPGVNGELKFAPIGYIDEPTSYQVSKAMENRATDTIVGRDDKPFQGALPAPATNGAAALPAPQQAPQQQQPAFQPAAPQQGFQPPPPPPPSSAPAAPFGSPAQQAPGFASATAAAPSSPEAPKRRGRKPKEQTAPAQGAPFNPAAAVPPQAFATPTGAPFQAPQQHAPFNPAPTAAPPPSAPNADAGDMPTFLVRQPAAPPAMAPFVPPQQQPTGNNSGIVPSAPAPHADLANALNKTFNLPTAP